MMTLRSYLLACLLAPSVILGACDGAAPAARTSELPDISADDSAPADSASLTPDGAEPDASADAADSDSPPDVASGPDASPDADIVPEDVPEAGPADVSVPDATADTAPDGALDSDTATSSDSAGEPPADPAAGLPAKSGEADYYDETVALESPGAARAPAPSLPGSGPWWRLRWSDDFNGRRPDEDPACYSRTPQCLPRVGWGPVDCPAAAAPQLAQLNKCNWAVYDFYNYMNGAEADGRNVNAFDWSEVRVEGGQLVLGARSQGSAHSDCGRSFDDPAYAPYGNFTTDCAFISGGLESRPHDNPWNGSDHGEGDVRGFDQAFGRFEVRGRLSYGPGTWPAFWMLPSTGGGEGWPGDGEIDVLENWSHNAHDSVGTFHDGDPATGMHFWDGHHWSAKNRDAYPQDGRADTFHNDWHTWAVEWDPDELRFYVDKWLIGVTWNGKPVERKRVEYHAGVPDFAFYWILNLSIAPKLGNWFENIFGDYRPDPDDFTRQELRVDHVRTFEQCRAPADFCPWGGTLVTGDGVPMCDLGAAPATDTWTEGGKVWTRRTRAGCEVGSDNDSGSACLLWDLPEEARPALANGRISSRTACSETTLQETCANPCEGRGTFDGYGCLLGIAPNELTADLADGVFYYRRTWLGGVFSDPECLPEHPLVSGEGCRFGAVPAGRSGFVTNEDDTGKFYLEPTCNPTWNLPNCASPCPLGGSFDGIGCRIRRAPSGTSPFVYGDGLYYGALASDPAEACWKGGSFDGANCWLQQAPAAGVSVLGDAFYLPAACPMVPWASATGR